MKHSSNSAAGILHLPLARRNFVKTSTASAATFAGLTLAAGSNVHAAGSDKLRVGLLGCGGRGAGAAANNLRSAENIQIHAMADLDVMNWAMGEVPRQVLALGARQVRVGPEFGHIYDHFAAEFEFANGVRFASYARQIEGCANRVAERIVGTKRVAEPSSGIITGANPFELRQSPNPYVQEHTDLINAIRSGTPLNEGKRLGESTMTAICGRMSAYTGRMVEYDWVRNESKEHLGPEKLEFGELPVDPVAMPGKTKLV